MTKRLRHIAPVQLGIVLAALYGILSLIVVPFVILAAVLSPSGQSGIPILLMLFIPIIYAVIGFIGGIIAGFIYNIVAKWTGGIEFTLSDAVPSLPDV